MSPLSADRSRPQPHLRVITTLFESFETGVLAPLEPERGSCSWVIGVFADYAQARLRRDMAAHEAADQSYLEQGVALLELASNAVRLYKSQESAEKRKLLNFVYSNCIWEDGTLHVEWRQPFEMLAETIAEARTTNGPGGADSGDFEIWLPNSSLVGKNEPVGRWVVDEDLPPSRSRRRERSKGHPRLDACHAETPAATGDSSCVPFGDDACHACVPSAAAGGTRPRKRRGKGVQHLFARARRYRQMLDSGQAKSLRDLGRQEGISGARVCQILNVLELAPEIVEQVDVPFEQLPPGINVTRLREIAASQDRDEQCRRFRRALTPV